MSGATTSELNNSASRDCDRVRRAAPDDAPDRIAFEQRVIDRVGFNRISADDASKNAPCDRASTGYALCDESCEPTNGGEAERRAWTLASVAWRQEQAFEPLLDAMDRGDVRSDFQTLVGAVRAARLRRFSLLEIGCGSAVNHAVLQKLSSQRIDYHGVDIGEPMIELARRRAPNARFAIADAASLPFKNAAFDLTVNGTALMHLPAPYHALAEQIRITRRFAVLHAVPVRRRGPTTKLTKQAYGQQTIEWVFREHELRRHARAFGLRLRRRWTALEYNLKPVIGERTVARTYLFEIAR